MENIQVSKDLCDKCTGSCWLKDTASRIAEEMDQGVTAGRAIELGGEAVEAYDEAKNRCKQL